jgi:hypothetical protein
MQWTTSKPINASLPSGSASFKGHTMKTYQIELKRTAYVNLTIEAESQDEAEALAWQELASDGSYGTESADWDIESIEEQTT